MIRGFLVFHGDANTIWLFFAVSKSNLLSNENYGCGANQWENAELHSKSAKSHKHCKKLRSGNFANETPALPE